MKISLALLLIISMGLLCCKEGSSNATKEYELLQIADSNFTATVDISTYKLLSDPQQNRRKDAEEIMRLKRKWPLAMQSLNPLAFDSILSKNFTFKGIDDFYNREDYIKNRTKSDEWKIILVKYNNMSLQFFGETAILSYTNDISNKSSKTGAVENEHISWVDVFIKENGIWKIGGSHAIDYRLDSTSNASAK